MNCSPWRGRSTGAAGIVLACPCGALPPSFPSVRWLWSAEDAAAPRVRSRDSKLSSSKRDSGAERFEWGGFRHQFVWHALVGVEGREEAEEAGEGRRELRLEARAVDAVGGRVVRVVAARDRVARLQ